MGLKGCNGKQPQKGAGIQGDPQAAEKTDESGNKWRKLYTGGGSHFRHCLEQFKEVYGEGNLVVEEEDPRGYTCFEQSGEPMFSIWLKIGKTLTKRRR